MTELAEGDERVAARASARPSIVEALRDAPGAVGSFLFYKAVSLLLRGVVLAYARLGRRQNLRWRVLSAETLDKPLMLPVIMTTSPRWNPHAIIASAGPLRVDGTLELDVRAAESSARSWTVVVHRFPGNRTVASIGSTGAPFAADRASLRLSPGTYTLVLRYYHWSEDVALPAVRVDGADAIESGRVPSDNNRFYADLDRRMRSLYRLMHAHVFVLLRSRAWLPTSFVERQYLPVGNPETRFFYGALRAGERLRITAAPRLLATHALYLTVYDRGSFPIRWYEIVEPEHTSDALDRDATYLIRCHREAGPEAADVSDGPSVSVVHPEE